MQRPLILLLVLLCGDVWAGTKLSWVNPTQCGDGLPIVALGENFVYCGTQSRGYEYKANAGPAQETGQILFIDTQCATGTFYFAATVTGHCMDADSGEIVKEESGFSREIGPLNLINGVTVDGVVKPTAPTMCALR